MSYLVPDHKPRLTRDEAHAILKDHSLLSLPATGEPVLIGLRGYYRDTMGEHGKNDRGIYDDAFIP